jgi:hypothetical protein
MPSVIAVIEDREPKGRVGLVKCGLCFSMHPWRRDGVPFGGIGSQYRRIRRRERVNRLIAVCREVGLWRQSNWRVAVDAPAIQKPVRPKLP